ncbi:MAG TPA: hypothetical protein DC063_09075 [Arenimonas sp.]|nr:hypothetical protein [Arenimonas sp.]
MGSPSCEKARPGTPSTSRRKVGVWVSPSTRPGRNTGTPPHSSEVRSTEKKAMPGSALVPCDRSTNGSLPAGSRTRSQARPSSPSRVTRSAGSHSSLPARRTRKSLDLATGEAWPGVRLPSVPRSRLMVRSGTSSRPSSLTSTAWVRSSMRCSLPELVTDITNFTVTMASAWRSANMA